MKKIKKSEYREVDVVFSIPGRLRLRVDGSSNDPLKILNNIKNESNITSGSYNSITNTFVLEYDHERTDLNKLILNFCGEYSRDMSITRVKVNYKIGKRAGLGYSSAVSMAFIILDLGINLMGIGTGSRYKSFVRWSALVTTMGAIFEHGYKELDENGAFDPEVMSIMYLFNSINKGTATNTTTGLYSPAIAWLLTFGRHILTKRRRSVMMNAVSRNGKMTICEEENKSMFYNQFIESCFDMYQNVNMKKSLSRI